MLSNFLSVSWRRLEFSWFRSLLCLLFTVISTLPLCYQLVLFWAMSGSPSESSFPIPEVEYEGAVPASILTRTVAIIKNHALQHRFDIEPRILEANFEVRVIRGYRLNMKIIFIKFSCRSSKKDKWSSILRRIPRRFMNSLVKMQILLLSML